MFGMIPPYPHQHYPDQEPDREKTKRLTVDKNIYRIRFENENEEKVDIVIEPKEKAITQ